MSSYKIVKLVRRDTEIITTKNKIILLLNTWTKEFILDVAISSERKLFFKYRLIACNKPRIAINYIDKSTIMSANDASEIRFTEIKIGSTYRRKEYSEMNIIIHSKHAESLKIHHIHIYLIYVIVTIIYIREHNIEHLHIL